MVGKIIGRMKLNVSADPHRTVKDGFAFRIWVHCPLGWQLQGGAQSPTAVKLPPKVVSLRGNVFAMFL